MKTIKTTLVCLAVLFASITASAQVNIGPMLAYGTDTDLGYGIKAEFSAGEKLSISPSFAVLSSTSIDFLGIKLKTSLSEINVDGHYTLSDNGNIAWYGLLGANVVLISVNAAGEKTSESQIGANIGAGAKFALSDSMLGFAQAKYGIEGAEQLGIHLGVYFTLGGN